MGMELSRYLSNHGYEVAHLSRRRNANGPFKTYEWDIETRHIENEALDTDFIVHLAGAGVADSRWTQKRKQLIRDSRVNSTQLLFDKAKELKVNLKGFISASAIGIYGHDTGETLIDEDSESSDDFLSQVVRDWEYSADQFRSIDIPTAKLRIGIVLASDGGALPKILQPIKFGIGSPIGTGKQYMSWIHLQDLCRMFEFVIENGQFDVFNAVAPNPVRNTELTQILAKKLKKPLLLPNVPGFALKLMFGEMAEILLGGNNVSSNKITSRGFQFDYPSIDDAIKNLLA